MSGLSILVVDDDKDALMLASKLLGKRGYDVLTADNGPEGIELAVSEHPDLVILDISMPGMDGGQVSKKLKENPQTQNIPIIHLTSLISRDDEDRSNHVFGGNIMLAKPCDIDDLTVQIERLTAAAAKE